MSTQPSELTSSDTNDLMAARLRGFGPLGILAILLILAGNFLFAPLSAVLVLVWVWLSRTPWREIGYVRPRNWVGSVVVGVVFGCAFKFLLKALVMPLLGGPEINPAYHYLAGNTAALPGMIYTMIVVAGFGEEKVFSGWMLERLGKHLGTSVRVRRILVLITTVLFSVALYLVHEMECV